ncbi:hypothetical protein IAU60_002255 [Kwoniella sp. DSM 27419]
MPRIAKSLIAVVVLGLLLLIHHQLPPSPLRQLRQQRASSAPEAAEYSHEDHVGLDAYSRDEYQHAGIRVDSRGLTYLGPESDAHPIEALIARGKELNDRLEARIAKIHSVEDSAKDYQRAFSLEPPRGFETWYDFTRSSVPPHPPPLPSLLPLAFKPFLSFLSLPVQILRRRIEDVRSKGAIFTFTFVPDGQGDQGTACDPGQTWMNKDGMTRGKGRVIVRGEGAWGWRCNNTLKVILPILPLMPKELFEMDPPLEIPFSFDDGPRGLVHDTFRAKSEALATAGKTWSEAQLERAEQAMRWTYGWAWACPEGTPLKMQATDLVLNNLQEVADPRKSFIADFDRSADFCSDPALLTQHNILLSGQHRAAVNLSPVVATCGTMWNSDIIGVPTDGVFEEVKYVAWEDKPLAKLFWRGSATGLSHHKTTAWRQSQRERLHFFAHDHNVSAKHTLPLLLPNGETRQYTKEELGKWLDMGLSGQPVQCNKEDGSCDDMAREIDFMPRVHKEFGYQFKYVMDVDGNGWSSRFRRLMASNNVVLKSTLYPEWFQALLIPWYHYVPVKLDYSDIHDVMAFFNGAPDGSVPGRDDLAKEIAANGKRFVDERWRMQDMQSYMYLLILEFWRMMSDDRKKATYTK